MIRNILSALACGGLLLSAVPAAAQAPAASTRQGPGEVTKSQARRHHQAAYDACTKATDGDDRLQSYRAFGRCMDKHGKLQARSASPTSAAAR